MNITHAHSTFPWKSKDGYLICTGCSNRMRRTFIGWVKRVK